MGWMMESLISVLVGLMTDIILFLFRCLHDFGIDIGYDPKSHWASTFSFDYYKHPTGYIDQIFPFAGNFMAVFIYMAEAFIVIQLITGLSKSMVTSLDSHEEHPASRIAGAILSMIAVFYSYSFFIAAERVANHFYNIFKYQQGVIVTEEKISQILLLPKLSVDFIKDSGELSGMALLLVTLCLFFFVTMAFVKLLVEVIERYITLAFLFYTCPLAFATLANKNLRQVFSKWIQMIVSQFLLMMMNIFFLTMFMGGWFNVFNPDIQKAIGGYFQSPADYFTKMVILGGTLILGQKVDEHLRSLGLSAAQTGQGLGNALLGSGYLAATTVKGMMRGANKFMDSRAKTVDSWKKESMAQDSMRQQANNQDSKYGHLGDSMPKGAYMDNIDTTSKQGAVNGFKSPLDNEGNPIIFTGQEAENIKDSLGVKDFNQSFPNDTSKTEAGNGLISNYDHDGNLLSQYGDKSNYEPADSGAAYRVQDTAAGPVISTLTPDEIDTAQGSMLKSLQSSDPSLSWVANEETPGTATGYKMGEDGKPMAVKQAKIDEVADFSKDRGGYDQQKTADGKSVDKKGLAIPGSDLSYSVQNLQDPMSKHSNNPGGFTNVKHGTYNPSLKEKSINRQMEGVAKSSNPQSQISKDLRSGAYGVGIERASSSPAPERRETSFRGNSTASSPVTDPGTRTPHSERPVGRKEADLRGQSYGVGISRAGAEETPKEPYESKGKQFVNKIIENINSRKNNK